jgi:hypothetical protein
MRLQRYIVVQLLLLAQGVCSDLPGTLVWSEQDEQYTLLRYQVDGQSITLDGLKDLASRCRVALQSKQFAAIQLFSGRADKCLFLTKGFHLPYFGWHALHGVCTTMPLQAGEIVAWRGGLSIRLRDAKGHVEMRILAGSNPLRFRHGRCDLEIIHIALPRGMGNVKESRIVLYARTQRPITKVELREWRGLFGAVLERLPFRNSRLSVRNDSWFISDSYFPVVPPFVQDAPPSLETHRKSPTLECWGTRGKEECVFVEVGPGGVT